MFAMRCSNGYITTISRKLNMNIKWQVLSNLQPSRESIYLASHSNGESDQLNMDVFSNPPSICVIGAGFSGLCTAIQLKKQLGLSTFTIFDQNEDIGGVWQVNTYPGCACDVPSHLYSLSFEPNPFWSKVYADQKEILSYLQSITEKHDIRQNIQFQHKVVGVEWEEAQGKWQVTVLDMRSGEVAQSKFDILVSAIGALKTPNMPEMFESFSGPKMHTARWDPSIDLDDKVVAVIGSGASGVQLIPNIVDKVKRLISYQRRPTWVLPSYQFTHSNVQKWVFARVPGAQAAVRKSIFWGFELSLPMYKVDTAMHKLGAKLARRHLRRQIKESDLRKKITPNFEFGCKRLTMSRDYYPALAKHNVTVVTSKIVAVTEDSIITEDGGCEKPDVLILATGFKVQDYFDSHKMIGRGGEDASKKILISLYAGTVSHWMPNAFFIMGPNSAPGHNSGLLNIETQVNWMIKVIREMMNRKARIISVKKQAEAEYMANIAERMKSTVWGNYECGSFFVNADGIVNAIWPETCTSFKKRLKSVNASHFDFSLPQ